MSEVSCLHVDEYESERLYDAVKLQFEQLNLYGLIHRGQKIVIKPNLLMRRKPQQFTTTHPAVVEAVIRVLQDCGADQITIADSPGGPYTKALLSSVYGVTGMADVAKRRGVSVNTAVGYQTKRAGEKSVACSEFDVIDPICEADLIIDICKLKTHGMVGLSGAVKNMFGSVPGLMKPELHFRFPDENDFCNMLIDLCETVRPRICFVDAIDAMQGDGPSGGSLIHTGMLIAGTNPYDIDLVLCKIASLDPKKILTVKHAVSRGLSSENVDKVTVLGDEVKIFEDFVPPANHGVDFKRKLPFWIPKGIVRHFESRPFVISKNCIGCGKCAESCPAHTIYIVNRKAKINNNKCIKCYCCHEMCPVNTIIIKRSRLYRL